MPERVTGAAQHGASVHGSVGTPRQAVVFQRAHEVLSASTLPRPVEVRPVGLPRVEGLPAWFSALVVATVYLPPVAAVLLPAGAVAVVDGVPAAWRLLAERMLRPVLGAGSVFHCVLSVANVVGDSAAAPRQVAPGVASWLPLGVLARWVPALRPVFACQAVCGAVPRFGGIGIEHI